MSKNRIVIDYYDQIRIECEDCGEAMYFSTLLDDEIFLTKKYMCALNARKIYDISHELKMESKRLRKIYDSWEKEEFK